MNKIVKFVKENKIIIFALAVIVLSFIFLALPGQFARFDIFKNPEGKIDFKTKLGGYQFIFNKGTDVLGNAVGKKVVGQGIVIIVFLALSAVGLCFSNKTSFFTLLTGLVLVVTGILFFTLSSRLATCYPRFKTMELEDKKYSVMCWVPYLLGSLVLVAGLLVVYKAVMMMKNEVKRPTKSSSGPTYNYLKK